MNLRPPLPGLPSFPTAAYDLVAYHQLTHALDLCRPLMKFPTSRAFILQAYARLWAHLAMERSLAPPQVATAVQSGYKAVQDAFLAEARLIGLQDRLTLLDLAPDIASLASRLWRQAKERQVQSPSGLPGLDPSGR